LIIRPTARWFDLHLSDLWRYRDLIFQFVWRDFAAQYKQSILGPLWFIIQPLLSTVVFTIVFGNIAGLSTDGLPKVLFYLSGQVVWEYFAGVLNVTSTTFVSNANVFGKVYFPRLVVPISVVISRLLQFGLRFVMFLGFVAYFAWRGAAVHVGLAAFALPLLVLIMAALALGVGIIFSSVTTKYRDLRFLLGFAVQLLMYATTVIYPLSAVSDRYRLWILANPMTPIVEAFRYSFLGTGAFEWWHLGYSAAFAAAVLLVGIILFTRIERTFMDTV